MTSALFPIKFLRLLTTHYLSLHSLFLGVTVIWSPVHDCMNGGNVAVDYVILIAYLLAVYPIIMKRYCVFLSAACSREAHCGQ